MRLATRTGLVALASAAVVMLLTGLVLRGQFGDVVRDRVDRQLERRAETAPLLVAVAPLLAESDLRGSLEGAQVAADGAVVTLGSLPDDALPSPTTPGFATVSAEGERWRLLTVEVLDVPEAGDAALVQLVAPLGDTETAIGQLRDDVRLVAIVMALAAGGLGYLLGSVAAGPLVRLRRDTAGLDGSDPAGWRVADRYGSPEVDDVAAALNLQLGRLAEETARRDAALDAARAFASGATHELRTPLQSAVTNLDIATSPLASADQRTEGLELARRDLQRLASSLAAVRALADAEFADPRWFGPVDLAELVDAAVADEARRVPDADVRVDVVAEGAGPVVAWGDGVVLAVANVVRNALRHGRPRDGGPPVVAVRVEGATVTVDDAGPGIDPDDRERVLERFERGSGGEGSGLGLAISREVAVAHGGSLTIDAGPLGGARVVLRFAPPSDPPA